MININKIISTAKSALTHSSYINSKNSKGKDNSRYVFLGMFAFKGKVAHWLVQNHVLGSGTELQQFYGNITGNSYMNILFEKWNLISKVRASNDFEIEKHRHIFVFGLLGYIIETMKPQELDNFIFSEFFTPNQFKLPKSHGPKKDKWSLISYFCKLKYHKAPKILTRDDENGITYAEIVLPEHTFTTTSKSYKYARKKVIHKALQFLLDERQNKLMEDPLFQTMQKLKEEENQLKAQQDRDHRILEWKTKQEIKKQIKTQKNILKQEKANIKDLKRKTNKAKIKSTKSAKKEFTAEDIHKMSSSKRRILEDKGIIPKRK